MKAIVINSPGQLALKEMKRPIPDRGEVLLKLLYGGICGSDLGAYRGSFAYVSYPRIPGHEFSAEVVEVNDNGTGLSPGMIVTANPYFNCGKCYSCRRGLVNCCKANQTMGVQREGAFAQYITMPVERIYPGQGLCPKTLALIEPLCIGYHGIERGQVKAGDRVLVVGGGGIGILAALAAKSRGAGVYLADVSPAKLKLASSLGIDGTFLSDAMDSYTDAVEKFTGGDGFDVAIEAVGLPETFQGCIDVAAFGGSVVVIGVSKKRLEFDFTLIQKKELRVFGSRNATRADFENVIELVKSGRIDPAKIITDVYNWQEAGKAFAEFDKSAGHKLKVMLEF